MAGHEPTVTVRVYGALNDFLPAARRQATLVCALRSRASVKDVLEALGIPHPEVDLVVVNSRAVGFGHLVRADDRVSAYPPFLTFDLDEPTRVGPPRQAIPRFVTDVHLGRLAAYLRFAGFDTIYRNDLADRELVATSAGDDRTLLTRDVGVLKHRLVTRGYFVRSTHPARQLAEVDRRFDLAASACPFTRCVRCNTALDLVPFDEIEHLLPPRTREHYRTYSRCPTCRRIYWQGTHYARIKAFLEMVLGVERRPAGSDHAQC